MSQNDKNRFLITTCAHCALATIPTIGSALLIIFLPDCTVTSQLFNLGLLNVLDQGFYSALFATMLVIAFVFMMGIRSNQSPVAIPDPTDLYCRVFSKSIRNDNPDDYSRTQRKLKAIKGYVALKLYFTFTPDLYESFFERTYQELLTDFLNENAEAGSSTISASNIFRHKRIVDISIVRLAGVVPQGILATM